MKKLIVMLLALCAIGVSAAKAETYFVGYGNDGCQVFYSTYRGFYRVCEGYAPIYFGWNYGGYGWGDYWQFNRGGNFNRNWRGNNWHGNNWHGGGHRGGGNWHGGHGGHVGHGGGHGHGHGH